MVTRTGQIMTAEQAARKYPDQRWEMVRGELIMMTPAGYDHCRIVNTIAYLLTAHVRPEGLGEVLTGEPGFYIDRDPDTLRAPDVAFVERGKAQASGRSGFADLVPDLVVEVVSPNDAAGDVDAKARMWTDHGVGLCWVVWPATRSVSVYRPGLDVQILHAGHTLDGGDVLPGFAHDVAEVFD